ncbi:SRPBCC family protein [Allosphingosinicella deserti]|nr:SRPBCC domain-containing protein [Sphingomonas deserti]
MMTDTMESSLVVERAYAADVEELWALWTTKDGFESWWGPEQFRAEIHTIEARLGGTVHYDMIADTPEAIAAMQGMNAPTTQPCRGVFSEFAPHRRLVLTQLIDFLPGVTPYESRIAVDFLPAGDGRVRMVVTLSQMHDAATSAMQREGFTSQLGKLDRRYGKGGVQGASA